jgi:hypothetical protein
MTGITVAKVQSKQSNGNGDVIAIVSGVCDLQTHEVDFTALIIDDSGNPTIKVYDRDDQSKAVFVRYRQNDRYSSKSLLSSIEYSNKFLVFAALASEKAAKDMINGPYGVTMLMMAALGSAPVPFFNYYKNTWGVLAEFKTNKGPLLIKVPTEDPAIKQVYDKCFVN